MIMENYFDRQFELRYYEIDKNGFASPTTVLTLLEETAADHCFSINVSLYDLQKQDIGWVLVSGFMQMDRYPAYKEKITIRTWLSKYSTVKGNRENIIFDEKDNIIGRAKSLWVFFDIKRRRPVQIFDNIKEKWSFCDEECINQNITDKIEAIESAAYKQEFIVKRSDTDMYNHVNNIRYLKWVIDSIPKEIVDNYFLYSIDGRFIGEAQDGDAIISLTDKGINNNSLIHTIKNQVNNKVCATAKTFWKKYNS
jgi:medium-chain acyl-[acyl-carrier-protein] hydrolase